LKILIAELKRGIRITVGSYGKENINDNGKRLIDICEYSNMRIANGFYKHRDIHKLDTNNAKLK
jgi:hypothetical protein